jgi:hypothetical protein
MRFTTFAASLALGLLAYQVPALADEPSSGASASGSASFSLGGSASASATSSAPSSSPSSSDAKPEKEKPDTSARQVAAWGAIGFGGLGLTLFVAQMIHLGHVTDERDEAKAKLPGSVDPCSVQPTSPYFLDGRTACDADETAHGVRNLGIVGLVGGIALITTGVVLLATQKKSSDEPVTTEPEKKEEPKASFRIAPVVGPTSGMFATGTF